MKRKHIIASPSAAIIAGSVFYYPARGRNNASPAANPARIPEPREEKRREIMPHAEDIQP